jgi:hypothetical protein
MFLNVPLCDWLTLTSFEKSVFNAFDKVFDAYLERHDVNEVAAEVRGYVGYKGFTGTGSCSLTEGRQSDRRHYQFQVTGGDSAITSIDAQQMVSGAKCTRIDLQVTVEQPEGFSARALADALNAASWSGTPRIIRLIENSDGMDTVYIGSQKSHTLIRIYVKEIGAEGGFAVRFEVQVRKPRSHAFWVDLCTGETDVGSFLAYEFGRLPKIDILLWSVLEDVLSETPTGVHLPKVVKDMSKRFVWFNTQVYPALQKLVNDHDYGEHVAFMLAELLKNDGGGA